MKKAFLAIFVLCATLAFGQNKGVFKRWTDIPNGPVLTSPQTVIPSQEYFASGFAPGAGSPTISAGTPRGVLTGTFSNSFVFYNSGATKWKFTISTVTPTIIGTSGTPVDHGFAGSGTTQNVELLAPDMLHPVIIRAGTNNGESGGKNGVQFLPTTTGGIYTFYNVFIDGAQSSGFQLNGDGASKYYDSIKCLYCKVVNVGQEPYYWMATHTSPAYAPATYVYQLDNLAILSGRDLLQGEHIANWQVNGYTGAKGGQNDVAGQNNGLQMHDCGAPSLVRNFILDSVKGPAFNIFGNGTVRNGRIRYQASATGGQARYAYVGDQASSQYGNTARTTLDTLRVENLDFEYIGAGTVTELFQWAEKTIPMKLTNCRKTANILSWYTDARSGGGSTSTITFVNCTNFTPPAGPTYKSYDRYDLTHYYRLSSTEDYDARRGAFTPHGL